ncbi:MAG TPA: Ig-like domain-containing protein, partial [Vicinamibacterales bacterium]
MPARLRIVVLCVLAAACGQSTTPTPAPPAVSSIAIAGTLALPAVGQTSQLVATAMFANGTSQVVTNQARWLSSNPTVATVTTSGLVAALTYGTAVVTATYQGVAGIGTLTITLNMTGTWKGTATDSVGSAQLTSGLTQTGTTISGTAALVYTSDTQASGSFTGTVSN